MKGAHIFIISSVLAACHPTNPVTVPLESKQTATDTNTMLGMLQTHNQIRNMHNLPSLTWSTPLSHYAQSWATHLASQNACHMQHRSHAGVDPLQAGENIYWSSAIQWSDGRTEPKHVSAASVVMAWADEKKDYDNTSNTCRSNAQCGHYTQLVWHTTTEVGCGMAWCPDKGQIWVCNYAPAGNWRGEKPY